MRNICVKDKLFNDENVPIDHLISPENLVTDEITRLIAYPGALQAHLPIIELALWL